MNWSLITRSDIEVHLIQARNNTEIGRISKNSVNRAQFTEVLILIARKLFSQMKHHKLSEKKQDSQNFDQV